MNGIVHPYYTVALAPAIAAVHRDRRNTVVAAPLRHPGRDGAGRHRAGQRPSWRRCCWRATTSGCRGCGRRSPSAGVGAAALLLVVGRLPTAGRPAVAAAGHRGVPGRARRVFHCHGGDPAQRGDPVGRAGAARRTRWRLRRAGRTARLPGSRAGVVRDAGRRRGRLHLGGGGHRLQQRGGLSIGQRRAGDGGRRVQRHRSVADARGVQTSTSPTGGSTTSSTSVDDGQPGSGHRRQRGGGGHRRMGGRPGTRR